MIRFFVIGLVGMTVLFPIKVNAQHQVDAITERLQKACFLEARKGPMADYSGDEDYSSGIGKAVIERNCRDRFRDLAAHDRCIREIRKDVLGHPTLDDANRCDVQSIPERSLAALNRCIDKGKPPVKRRIAAALGKSHLEFSGEAFSAICVGKTAQRLYERWVQLGAPKPDQRRYNHSGIGLHGSSSTCDKDQQGGYSCRLEIGDFTSKDFYCP
jgi:hypothetical protein